MELSETRRIAAALSLANLSLFRIWNETLTYTRADTYTMKLPPEPGQYQAILLVMAILAFVFWLLIAWAQRSTAGKVAFLLSLLLPANAIREVGSTYTPYLRGELIRVIGSTGTLVLVGLAVITVLAILLNGVKTPYRVALTASLVLAPFIPFTVAQDLWRITQRRDAAFQDKPLAPKLGRVGPRRVVWMIFDEMDERLAFEAQRVTLPEFAKLRQESIYATAAYSPSSSTLLSIPSLLTGHLVKAVRQVSVDDLETTYAETGQEVKWSDQPNIFSRTRALGYDTALVGWYHPYCRELNGNLTSCWWTAMPMQYDSVGHSFSESTPKYLRSLFETSLLSPFGQSLSVEESTRRVQALMKQACSIAADSSISLVFLHIQPPHAPHPYNGKTHQFTLANSPVAGYLDSLQLADLVLGRIRTAMEESGVWDSSDVLVSADHSYRSSAALDGHARDRRVPFLLKLARSRDCDVYKNTFNTILTDQLVLAILRNEIKGPGEAAAWLDHNASPFHGL